MKRFEGFFEGFQETKLFFQVWETHRDPQGLLVVTHGQGEHSECYHRLVEALAETGWTVLAWDLRGHGRSEGQRGFAANFLDYIRDFESFWNQVLPLYRSKKPTVFFGHSMGALIQLKSLAGFVGGESLPQILSSPFLGLSMQVPTYKEAAAVVLKNVVPQVTLSNEIRDEDLTRDPAVLEEFKTDTLRHHKISAGVYLGAQECQASVLSRPEIWKGPLLMLVSDNDPVVSTKTNLEFFERIKSPCKDCQVFENRKHELVNDLGREEVFDKIRTFLAEISGSRTKESSPQAKSS
jgi:alpha-beta hydrolase superfamily lysophospholipase